MYIRRMHLYSYGPFEDSGLIELERGVNLVVGQNNAGKSALLRSLRADWPSWPHRNLRRYRALDLLPSRQEVELIASSDEVRRGILSSNNAQQWPIAEQPSDLSRTYFHEHFLSADIEYCLTFGRHAGGTFKVDNDQPVHNLFQGPILHHLHISPETPNIAVNGLAGGNADSIANVANVLWVGNIFRFDAERMNVGRCAQQDTEELAPNASNLPAVLQTMRGRRPGRFETLITRLREILPSIHSITPAPIGTSETEILVWPTSAMENPEHGFSLNDSGTGVAQVIAILTAVLTRSDSVIVIDEINSFLHPAAAKTLIRILRTEHNDHQYIISTHSAEVISASQPNSLYVIRRNGFESSMQRISVSNIDELRELGDLLGISIGDIFAADFVLWVEGRTEELCFPFLLNHWEIEMPTGLVVSPVAATGDFIGTRRDVELLFSVYERLSKVTLPLVKAVAFTFDSEELSGSEKVDLVRRAAGRLLFLPRRHLECFVIDPYAIADLINRYDQRNAPIGAAEVENEITRLGGDKKYKANGPWKGVIDDEWAATVDGARLLGDLVQNLTEARVSYEKTRHTLDLFQSILSREPDQLNALREYLVQLMNLLAEGEHAA